MRSLPKWLYWSLFAALLGFVVGGSTISAYYANHRRNVELSQDQSVESSKHKSGKSIEESLAAIWSRTWDDPVAFYTFVLGIFTALLAAVSATQIVFLIRADQSTRRTLVLAQRPVLRIRNVVVDPSNPDLVPRVGIFQEGHPVRGQFYVSNVGGTPAKIIGSYCTVYWNIRGLPLRRPYEGEPANGAVPNVTIAPGQSIPALFLSSEILGAGARTIGTQVIRAVRLFVMGWIEYEDDIGQLRRMAFCREFKGDVWGDGHFYPVENSDYEHEY